MMSARSEQFGGSQSDPLRLIEAEFLAPVVIELRRARTGMVGHLGCLFQCAAVLEIGGDPGLWLPNLVAMPAAFVRRVIIS
jgi:hypothetical protein